MMGRKSSKSLRNIDSRKRGRMYDNKRKPIQDLYGERIRMMAMELGQNKPKSQIFHVHEDDVQKEAISNALRNLESNGEIDLREVQGSFYKSMAKRNKQRQGKWKEFD